MNNSNDSSNNCSSYNYIALASTLAIWFGEQFDTDDLNIFAAFFTALGDNIAMITALK